MLNQVLEHIDFVVTGDDPDELFEELKDYLKINEIFLISFSYY